MIVDFLSCLWTYAKGKITEEIGSVVDLGESHSASSLTDSVELSRVKSGSCGRKLINVIDCRFCRCAVDGSCSVGRSWMSADARSGDKSWLGTERKRRG